MQPNKSIKIFINYILGPLLFGWLCFSIYQQILHQPHLQRSWEEVQNAFQSSKIALFFGAVLLLPVNWGLETAKWQRCIRTVYPLSFLQAYKAVLSGVSVSVTLPNRVGEYVGRIMYLPEGNRLKTISVTIIGSIAQLLATITAGLFGLVILKATWLRAFPQLVLAYQFLVYGLALAAVLLCLLYFNAAAADPFFRRRFKKYAYLTEALRSCDQRLLWQVLLLSFARYLVFLLQYLLLFYFFGVKADAGALLPAMSVVFLAMTIIPSIALVEVGLRNEISIQLIGLLSANTLGISFTSVSVWLINLILPAIAGSLLILRLKVFRGKS